MRTLFLFLFILMTGSAPAQGYETAPSTPEQVCAKIVAEQKVNAAAVKAANLRPE